MIAIDDALIEYVVRTIVEKFDPERVVLFGSHARGDAGPESDLDLLVEMESELRTPERAIHVDRVFGLRRWAMDIIVYTPDEVERLTHINGTLMSIVHKEGRVLYERGRVELPELAG